MSAHKSPGMASLDDEQFIDAYLSEGGAALADRLGVSRGRTSGRMSELRKIRPDIPIMATGGIAKLYKARAQKILCEQGVAHHAPRLQLEIKDGTCIIFSDAHYWPGAATVSHRALVKMVHETAPAAIICNGDAVDMASVSRHPPIGWEKRPSVQQEIECAQDRLGEILSACTKRTRRTWNLGNHDARFETKLASVAPEYAKIAGIHLHDHFPEWDRAWSTWINDEVVVKHRFKGGDHATWNNTIKSGKTTVTGHLHSARVTPFTDYNGTRFGVDTGCLAEPFGEQFINYTEDNPRNWVSGFCLLTFHKGQLLWPELVTAWDDKHVQFRGELIKV